MSDNVEIESYLPSYFISEDVPEYDIEEDEVIEVPVATHRHPRSSCKAGTSRTTFKKPLHGAQGDVGSEKAGNKTGDDNGGTNSCSSSEGETAKRTRTPRRQNLRKRNRPIAAQNALAAQEYERSGSDSWNPVRACETTVEMGRKF